MNIGTQGERDEIGEEEEEEEEVTLIQIEKKTFFIIFSTREEAIK